MAIGTVHLPLLDHVHGLDPCDEDSSTPKRLESEHRACDSGINIQPARTHALTPLAVQTGLRLSEITDLCRSNVCLTTGAHVRVVGKGRKERSTPLTKSTANVLRSWMREIEPSVWGIPRERFSPKTLSSHSGSTLVDPINREIFSIRPHL